MTFAFQAAGGNEGDKEKMSKHSQMIPEAATWHVCLHPIGQSWEVGSLF